jgi:hypothetical protein
MPLLSKLRSDPPIPETAAIAMLVWALFPDHAYAYFVLLRWVTCAVFIWLTVRAYKLRMTNWCWVLGFTAALYNPLVPAHLNREIWSWVNVATVVLLLATAWRQRAPPQGRTDLAQ